MLNVWDAHPKWHAAFPINPFFVLISCTRLWALFLWRTCVYISTYLTAKRNLSIVSSFLFNLYPSSSVKNKNVTKYIWKFKLLHHANQPELDTCSCELYTSQWLVLSPPKISTFPPESPCIYVHIHMYNNIGNKSLLFHIMSIPMCQKCLPVAADCRTVSQNPAKY